MYNKILEDTGADLKTEWEYLAKTFGSCTMVEVAHAVISAVNYDEVCRASPSFSARADHTGS